MDSRSSMMEAGIVRRLVGELNLNRREFQIYQILIDSFQVTGYIMIRLGTVATSEATE